MMNRYTARRFDSSTQARLYVEKYASEHFPGKKALVFYCDKPGYKGHCVVHLYTDDRDEKTICRTLGIIAKSEAQFEEDYYTPGRRFPAWEDTYAEMLRAVAWAFLRALRPKPKAFFLRQLRKVGL